MRHLRSFNAQKNAKEIDTGVKVTNVHASQNGQVNSVSILFVQMIVHPQEIKDTAIGIKDNASVSLVLA